MEPHQVVEEDLITVTERAAIAAAHTMGIGDASHSEGAAVKAMREGLDEVHLAGRIVIGKGERERAPMLYDGEEIGRREGEAAGPAVDIAVHPLEGTQLCAIGGPGAVTALAAARRGDLLHAPGAYMEKIVVGPTARGSVHLDAPVPENLRNIAQAFGREVGELTIVVLDRERHRQLIGDIRDTGARIRLISEGDLGAGIAVAVRGTGVHAVMGTSGAPEGVITAAAMRCLGGEIQGRLTARDDEHAKRLAELGFRDLGRAYSTEELARGERIVFSCTGVTDGELLRGVRFFGGGSRTSTLFMSLSRRILRFVDTIHRDDLTSPINFR